MSYVIPPLSLCDKNFICVSYYPNTHYVLHPHHSSLFDQYYVKFTTYKALQYVHLSFPHTFSILYGSWTVIVKGILSFLLNVVQHLAKPLYSLNVLQVS